MRYRELLADEAAPVHGVEKVLAELRGSVPMAVVTSCRRGNFLHMHRRSGLLDYFDFILTREDYRNTKPDPEPYLTACRRAGLPPGACLAVEDSQRGVAAAAAAGIAVVAFPGELNDGGDFSRAGWRIDDVQEVVAIFKGSGGGA